MATKLKMSVRIGDLLLVEHYLDLVSRLKYREDLTLSQKRDFLSEADEYVVNCCGRESEVEKTFGKEHSRTFYFYLFELCDVIASAEGYFKTLFEREDASKAAGEARCLYNESNLA